MGNVVRDRRAANVLMCRSASGLSIVRTGWTETQGLDTSLLHVLPRSFQHIRNYGSLVDLAEGWSVEKKCTNAPWGIR